MKKLYYILVISIFIISFSLHAAVFKLEIHSAGMDLRVNKIADGLGVPWGMVFLSAEELLITERGGNVKILNINNGKIKKLNNVPHVMAEGQGGMLDVALSPNYKASGWIYFTYVKQIDGKGATTLARAKLVNDRLDNWQELLVTKSATSTDYHFGSRITFDGKGHVFFSIGDRGERPNAQDLTNHAGSIIRLNMDGTIPDDNPFAKKIPNQNLQALPEIWSYGHRNPQGLAYDYKNRRLWSIEHGPRGGDELNLIEPGMNYGWPVISYGKEYWGPVAVGEGTHRKDMQQPVKYYVPSIAPGSLLVYSGESIPGWKGDLFAGALKLQHINRIVLSEDGQFIKEERLLGEMGERIRALIQSPEGWMYFSTDSGAIYRILPKAHISEVVRE